MTVSGESDNWDSEVHNLTLGHIIAAIRDNKANKPYLRHLGFLAKRHKTMVAWEGYLRSLIPAPHKDAASAKVIDAVPRLRRSA
jgi:hypothetical protein